MIDFDHVMAEIGGMGRYQVGVTLMLLYWSMPAGYNVVAPVFLNYIPAYRCKVSEFSTCTTGMKESDILNLTTPIKPDGSYDGCKRYKKRNNSSCINTCDCIDRKGDVISCNEGYHYDTSLFTNTVASEFDLVCEHAYLDSLATSIYMVGCLVGSLLFGYVSDRWGRKVALGISTIATQAALIACSFVHSYWLFVACRFVISVFDAGVYFPLFVYAMEIVSDKWRTCIGCALHISFALGYMMLSGFAYLWREWHHLQIAMSVFFLPTIVFAFIIPESPRWLFANGFNVKAKNIVRQMGKWNRVKINEETIWKQEEEVDSSIVNENDIKDKKYSTVDLLNKPGIRFVTLLMMFNWFTAGFVYYGVALGVGFLSGDIFINNALGGIVEIGAYVIIAIFMDYTGRRAMLIFMLCLTWIGLISSMVVTEFASSNQSFEKLSIVFNLAARLGMSAAFGAIMNFTSELFPTVIRGNAIAVISMFSFIGSMVAPFLLPLQTSISWLPNVLFGATAALSALLTICLPETKDQHLLESIEAAETFYAKNKFSFESNDDYELLSLG